MQQRSEYINRRNVAWFLEGAIRPLGRVFAILEDGLRAWDQDTGIPSRLIQHWMRHETTPTFNRRLAGIIATAGQGMSFVVQKEDSQPSEGTRFQLYIDNRGRGPDIRLEVSWRYLLKSSKDVRGTYTIYNHAIIFADDSARTYYGVTSRAWQVRFNEHVRAARTSSPYLLHKAIREDLRRASKVAHVVIAAGATKEQAYDLEEYLVDKYSLYPNHPDGLNMIPGGYEGLRFLAREGVGVRTADIEPEEREKVVVEYLKANPRKGIPNPLIAGKWLDDKYAEAVICGHENRLSAFQVREIRALNVLGLLPAEIATKVGAKSIGQVKRVLSQRTYSRIA